MALSLKVPKLEHHVRNAANRLLPVASSSIPQGLCLGSCLYLEESTFKITVIIHLRQIQLGTFMSNALQVNFTYYFLFIQTVLESLFFTFFLVPNQVCYLINLVLTTKTGSWQRFAECQRSCSAQSSAFCFFLNRKQSEI